MNRITPSLWDPMKRIATTDTAPCGAPAVESKWWRMVKATSLTVGIAAMTLSLTACIAPVDHDDEVDGVIASQGFALDTGDKGENNGGGVDTSKSGTSKRESSGRDTGSSADPGDVDEPDPVPWKGSGSNQDDNQDGNQDGGD